MLALKSAIRYRRYEINKQSFQKIGNMVKNISHISFGLRPILIDYSKKIEYI
jgi:hypothetical protein